jgi:hypothetical protein
MASRLERQIERIELRGKPSDEARREGDDLGVKKPNKAYGPLER